jgi:hypothetical protein
MKIVTGSIAVTMAALLIGIAGAAQAQQPGSAGLGLSGTQAGGGNNAAAAAGTTVGTDIGTGLRPTPGVGTSAGATGSIGSGPALNNMRANGTSLDMSPDPRAPNLTGHAAPRR